MIINVLVSKINGSNPPSLALDTVISHVFSYGLPFTVALAVNVTLPSFNALIWISSSEADVFLLSDIIVSSDTVQMKLQRLKQQR